VHSSESRNRTDLRGMPEPLALKGSTHSHAHSTAASAAQFTGTVSTRSSAPDDASIRKTSTASASWLATSISSPLGDSVKLREFEPLQAAAQPAPFSTSGNSALMGTAKMNGSVAGCEGSYGSRAKRVIAPSSRLPSSLTGKMQIE
jgi:hypothetical protein